jgi:hypothetical protein
MPGAAEPRSAGAAGARRFLEAVEPARTGRHPRPLGGGDRRSSDGLRLATLPAPASPPFDRGRRFRRGRPRHVWVAERHTNALPGGPGRGRPRSIWLEAWLLDRRLNGRRLDRRLDGRRPDRRRLDRDLAEVGGFGDRREVGFPHHAGDRRFRRRRDEHHVEPDPRGLGPKRRRLPVHHLLLHGGLDGSRQPVARPDRAGPFHLVPPPELGREPFGSPAGRLPLRVGEQRGFQAIVGIAPRRLETRPPVQWVSDPIRPIGLHVEGIGTPSGLPGVEPVGIARTRSSSP